MNLHALTGFFVTTCVLAADPAFEWAVATPESQGVSSAKLGAIQDRLAGKKTRAFLVVRNDRLVHEWYAPGVSATTLQGTASLAKALVGGMTLAVAITDGGISLDDPAARFVPQWKDDAGKSRITVRHLGSHTSGLSDSTTEDVKHEDQPGWMGEFWKRLDPPHDPFTIARDQTPMLFSPGEKIAYSNPGIGMLSYCVTAAIRDGAHKDIRTLLRERLMRPIGVPDAEWSAGYGKTFVVEGLPLVGTWGGGSFTPRATARLGRLVLRHGDWEGRRLLTSDAVRQVTGDAGLTGNCGMGWWTNGGRRYDKLPRDAVWGAGAGDQLLLVIPSLNLIMVRNGETLAPGPDEPPVRNDDLFTRYHDYRARILFEPLADAVLTSSQISDLPAGIPPRSTAIKEVRWAPIESIRRAARGGDNWPLAWADDDALYAAYGDGNGFEPFVPGKLSLGFARITGGPSDFIGTNLQSPTGETHGDGPAGKKASGLLCVEGTLYLWARNAANSQLAWSSDHGATWSWADWRFTESFGCPTFLDFGKNHSLARDEFVFCYSPDSNSAYEAADRVVLARAPKSRLRDRAAYEFFAGSDPTGGAQWTHELASRRAVFTHAGHCYRSRVSFSAPLDRFFLVQPAPSTESRDRTGRLDTRSNGGLAIYDAPDPWGPWSTVFFASRWDVGPGDSASLPCKWMSADGTRLHLVFSGDDCFSVRQLDLVPAR
jgi:CubicO group peptidase (beta-lactamase class C family)